MLKNILRVTDTELHRHYTLIVLLPVVTVELQLSEVETTEQRATTNLTDSNSILILQYTHTLLYMKTRDHNDDAL